MLKSRILVCITHNTATNQQIANYHNHFQNENEDTPLQYPCAKASEGLTIKVTTDLECDTVKGSAPEEQHNFIQFTISNHNDFKI